MHALRGKKILIGVAGSIAAYKSVFLLRLLVRAGAEVRVVMTPAATSFIGPVNFSTLSGHPVHIRILEEGDWQNHVELGLWADLYLIAPLTANTLSSLAHGRCDNMVTAAYLSARCPVMIAPAMDLDMWLHPATRRNLQLLMDDGVQLLPVGEGELASGLHGPGRMAEPEQILEAVSQFFRRNQSLAGMEILVTAGPTREAIDPVRYVSNHSSGKMGIAIADALAARGGRVHLLLGPTHHRPQSPEVHVILVETARDMLAEAESLFPQCRAAVFAAAVADYRPQEVAPHKLKKKGETHALTMTANPDIAATLGSRKQAGQVLVGFALETDNELVHARTKLLSKHQDFIVLNSLRDPGAGFGGDTNQVRFLYPDNNVKAFGLKSKRAVAEDIVEELAGLLIRC
jgi:phosphopantothenoylcysteine decarboxylase/phosphopantothenate--cysteine ligase